MGVMRNNGQDVKALLLDVYQEWLEAEAELHGRLRAIQREAEAELERVEKHGGCARFAECIRLLARVE